MTNPQIGVRLSRDPTTILHAIRKIKNELPALQPDIDEIERRIRQCAILHGEREKKW
jgi:chromosomal replication initiation ATPase DnaA